MASPFSSETKTLALSTLKSLRLPGKRDSPTQRMHQRPRLLQKKPPPPSNSTRTTMIKRVSVDIRANNKPGKDHALLGVPPIGPVGTNDLFQDVSVW
jgi:hypothetical protein